MAAPSLTVATESGPPGWGGAGSFDVSAATGGVQGQSGADYLIVAGGFSFTRRKLDGAFQLNPEVVGVGVTFGNYSNWWTPGFSINMTDEAGEHNDFALTTNYSNNTASYDCPNGTGIRYVLPASQKLREFHFIGANGGGIQVTATLSDGSLDPEVLNIGAGDTFFKAAWRGVDQAGTLELKILNTAGGTDFIAPVVVYIPVPVKAPMGHGMGLFLPGRY